MRPWTVIERVETPEGPLELRQRGEHDFLITIGGRVLMNARAHQSEDELGRLGCAGLRARKHPRILLGGLGMGFTLRAALDELPRSAEVTVVDLNPRVVAWCQGPLGVLTGSAAMDPRVVIQIGDVTDIVKRARSGAYDAIVLDLYEGPHHALGGARDPLYGVKALAQMGAAVRPGGVVAVWSEEADAPFEARFSAAGFSVQRHRLGRGGRAHIIYVGARPGVR
ncbi:MAG TPA: spermidine synthase [Polyangia bacterium]|jgi:spermidine synthase|nr:spermidine synthase [Polyangia bacterium]